MKHMFKTFLGLEKNKGFQTLLILIRKVVYLVIIASFLSVGYQGGGVVLKSFSPFLFLLRFRSKCLKVFPTLNLLPCFDTKNLQVKKVGVCGNLIDVNCISG